MYNRDGCSSSQQSLHQLICSNKSVCSLSLSHKPQTHLSGKDVRRQCNRLGQSLGVFDAKASGVDFGFRFRANVIMTALGLEEDGSLGVSPEVRDRVATVSLARLYHQPALATSIGTSFVLLLAACLVTNGGPEMNTVTIVEEAIVTAHKHTQA